VCVFWKARRHPPNLHKNLRIVYKSKMEKVRRKSIKQTPTQKLLRNIYDYVTGIEDIPLDDRKRENRIFPIQQMESLIGKDSKESKGSLLETGTEHEDEKPQTHGFTGDQEAQDIDEDFAFVDDDIWGKLVNPYSLYFRSLKRETIYFRTALLPARIILCRFTSLILIIVLLFNISIIQFEFGKIVWILSLAVGLLMLGLSWFEKGKYYIAAYIELGDYKWIFLFIEVFLSKLFDSK
jgi:hypothetical protein